MAIKVSEHRELVAQHQAANAKIVELEKKLKDTESAKSCWYSQNEERGKEIEQVHQILDSLTNPPPRKSKHEESWRQVELSLTARLAAWLASR